MFNLTLNGSLEFKLRNAFIIIYLLNETNSDRLILLFHVSHFLQFTNKENQQKATNAWMSLQARSNKLFHYFYYKRKVITKNKAAEFVAAEASKRLFSFDVDWWRRQVLGLK